MFIVLIILRRVTTKKMAGINITQLIRGHVNINVFGTRVRTRESVRTHAHDLSDDRIRRFRDFHYKTR